MIDHAINHAEVTQEFIDSLPPAPELGLIDPPCVKFAGDQKLFLCAIKGRWVWATQITLDLQHWPPVVYEYLLYPRNSPPKSVVVTVDNKALEAKWPLLVYPLTEGFTLHFAEEATAVGWAWEGENEANVG